MLFKLMLLKLINFDFLFDRKKLTNWILNVFLLTKMLKEPLENEKKTASVFDKERKYAREIRRVIKKRKEEIKWYREEIDTIKYWSKSKDKGRNNVTHTDSKQLTFR